MIWRQQHRITLSAYSQVQQSLFATSRTRKWEAGGNEVRTQSGRSIRARRRRWWRHLHYKFPLIFHFSFAESLAGHDSAPPILLRSIGLTFPGSSATEMTGNRRPTPPLLPTTGQQVHRPHPPTLIARPPHKDHWTCSANAWRDRSLRLSVCPCPLDYIQFHTISKREDLQIGGIGGVLWIDSCDGQDTVSLHLPMIDRCKWFRAHGLTVSFWTLRLCQSPWSNNCGDKDSSNVDQYRLSVTNKEGVRTDWQCVGNHMDNWRNDESVISWDSN